MPTYADIPDRCREVLAGPARPWADEQTDLAVAYAAAARDAADRLRRCRDYLRRGLRSEAVHLAACQPPLADLLPALDFPEADAWAGACAARGLPAPPRVRASDLAPLAAAAAAERRLDPLLATFRMQALAAAPARDRLATARALAARDPASPAFADALRALEPARLGELRSRAKAAFRADDAAALAAVEAEVAAGPWTVEVPDDLRVGLERAVRQTRRRAARNRLGALAAAAAAAQAAGDRPGCAARLDDWAAALADLRVTAPPELAERVTTAARWLATEDRRAEVGGRLRAAREAIDAAAAETTGRGPDAAPPADGGVRAWFKARFGRVPQDGS